MAKSGKQARQIGRCAPLEYKGPAMSNPYWEKMEFYKQNTEFRTSSDSGMDPLASIEIASPDIASPEIASAEIVSPDIKSADTAEPVADQLFPADAGLNQAIPAPPGGPYFPRTL